MRELGDFYKFECIRKLSKKRFDDWNRLAEIAKEILDINIPVGNTPYTLHTFSHHCYNIYRIISDILVAPDIWENRCPALMFSDDELFLLDVAVLFHDLTMNDPFISKAERARHSDDSAKEFAKLCKDDKRLGSIFRDHNDYIDIISDIIRAHSDIKDDKGNRSYTLKEIKEYIGQQPIRVRMLAGILRLADELDVTMQRFPEVYEDKLHKLIVHAHDTSNLNQSRLTDAQKENIIESAEHWKKLKCFKRIYLENNNPKLLVNEEFYKANPGDTANKIEEVVNKITKELNHIIEACKQTDFHKFVTWKQLEVNFSELADDTKEDGIAYRTQIFYKLVLPFLLNEYLRKKNKDIHDLLADAPESLNYEQKLPFIELLKLENDAKLELEISERERRIPKFGKQFFEFLHWRAERKEANLYDRDKYILDYIEGHKLFVQKSSYLKSFGSADINYFNLIRSFPERYFYTDPQLSDISEGRYPKFNEAIEHWINQLRDVIPNEDKKEFTFKGYHAGLGVSVLTVIKYRDNEDGKCKYKYPITKNSVQKATGGHDRIVIPAGSYDPCGDWDDKGNDLKKPELQVLREFGEELLGKDELRDVPNKTLYEMLDEIKIEPSAFNELTNKEKETDDSVFGRLIYDILYGSTEVTVIATGVIFDIFRMRPEITYLLILEDPIYDREYTQGWESEKIDWYDLESPEEYKMLIQCQDEPLVPPGLGALILGREKALEHITK